GRVTRLARANAYAALEGLVSRGAAQRAAGRPARYRPADPGALLARLAAEQGEALDRLSRALQDASHPAEPETRIVAGARAVANVVQQLVARATRSEEHTSELQSRGQPVSRLRLEKKKKWKRAKTMSS